MIKQKDLESAIGYRNRLLAIKTFQKGCFGAEPWQGPVKLAFGAYNCEISMKCDADHIRKSVDGEIEMLENTLGILGVELED